jgi:2-polyprenyl-3-methyl-5-hydroxy-6-metoxy-1,4-benzoquinol methylase
MNSERKKHWEKVYETKSPNEVSWTQKKPVTSLEFIKTFGVSKDAKIIDIGGGDSLLVDYLLELGYTNITVLDISALALEKAKARLGEKAGKVIWIVSDITSFQPTTIYDIWHDRATS